MEGFIYFEMPQDEALVNNDLAYLAKLDDAKILESFEKQRKLGIVGVRRQAIYLVALRIEMKKRFGDSPILIENDCLVKFQTNEKTD